MNAAQIPARRSPAPKGRYQLVTVDGTTVITSVLGPVDNSSASGFSHVGRLGASVDAAAGRKAAANCAQAILLALHQHLGSLDVIEQVVNVRGYLSTTPDFDEHVSVMDGASEAIRDVLGSRGDHTRCTVGVASLPFGVPVVVELTARIAKEGNR